MPFTAAATKMVIAEVGLVPDTKYKVWFRCSAGAASATVLVKALLFQSDAPSVSSVVTQEIATDIAQIEVGTIPTEGTTVDVDFDASVASAAAVTAGGVKLVATEDCYYVWGATPTATTAAPSTFLPAGVIFISKSPGTKIAAIKRNVAGKLSITPLT